MTKEPAVYILASQRNGTLYIGVTSDLVQRIWEHKVTQPDGFTKENHVHILVYYEYYDDMDSAIRREKQMKAWKRQWKIRLIEENNPEWNDLYEEIVNHRHSCDNRHPCEGRGQDERF
jgi:putative endonuclease